MSDVEDLFMRQLLDAFPEFRADLNDELRVYEERKADAFFDPPTADSFLMSLTQAAVNRYLAGGQAEKRQLRALFGYLESRFGSDPEIDELLESRFVQILPAPDGPRAQVLDLLGPKLHAARLRMFWIDCLRLFPRCGISWTSMSERTAGCCHILSSRTWSPR
jgi:hypothetical protein